MSANNLNFNSRPVSFSEETSLPPPPLPNTPTKLATLYRIQELFQAQKRMLSDLSKTTAKRANEAIFSKFGNTLPTIGSPEETETIDQLCDLERNLVTQESEIERHLELIQREAEQELLNVLSWKADQIVLEEDQ